MRNPATPLQRFSQSLTAKAKSSQVWSVSLLIAAGCTAGSSLQAQAASPETAPPELKDALTQIDAAANRRDVEGVMQFYAASFKNSDGLTHTAMAQALTQLWERYPQLTYRTELQNWDQERSGIVAETVTYITGTQAGDSLALKLESTLRSRQRFEAEKIVQQDILAERTQLTSGANPPKVEVKLPEQVRVGQPFNFDVIVQEPLGNSLLLGTALEEPIEVKGYNNPANFELELLQAGGIFKQGRAPLIKADQWLSAVLIRGDGVTMVTQRLQVVDRLTSASPTP